MSLLHAALFAALASNSGLVHLPHDNVHDVAASPRPDGGIELVVVANNFSKVQRTSDEGLSWSPVTGEGLERTAALQVEWWPRPVDPCFLIGGIGGVWEYDPVKRTVQLMADGLPSNVEVVTLSVPRAGDGAPTFVSSFGEVYRWSEAQSAWDLLLTTGNPDIRPAIVQSPLWNSAAGPGASTTIMVGIAGQLYYSTDSGSTWTLHPQFTNVATQPTDWSIRSIAMADNYATSGNVVIGRHWPRPR